LDLRNPTSDIWILIWYKIITNIECSDSDTIFTIGVLNTFRSDGIRIISVPLSSLLVGDISLAVLVWLVESQLGMQDVDLVMLDLDSTMLDLDLAVLDLDSIAPDLNLMALELEILLQSRHEPTLASVWVLIITIGEGKYNDRQNSYGVSEKCLIVVRWRQRDGLGNNIENERKYGW
jgi:hypothetical protein